MNDMIAISIEAVENGFIIRAGNREGYVATRQLVGHTPEDAKVQARKLLADWLKKWSSIST